MRKRKKRGLSEATAAAPTSTTSAPTYDREALNEKFRGVAMSFGVQDVPSLPDLDAMDLSEEQKVCHL